MKGELIIINVILALTVIGATWSYAGDGSSSKQPILRQASSLMARRLASRPGPRARPDPFRTGPPSRNRTYSASTGTIWQSKPRKVRLPRVPARSC